MKTERELIKNREKNRKWYKNNIEKARECSRRYRKNNATKRREGRWCEYGILNSNLSSFKMENFIQLLKVQENKCKICNKHSNNLNRLLDVDHDHQTGIVRGLICRSCNLKLGHYEQDRMFYEKAEQYLKVNN